MTQRTDGWRRAAIGLLAVVVLATAAACGGGGDDEDDGSEASAPVTSPTSAPLTTETTPTTVVAADAVLTLDQLVTALPADGDVPEGFTVADRCPGSPACFAGEVASLTAAREDDEGTTDLVILFNRFADAAAAEAQLATEREVAGERAGPFDVPLQDRGDGTYTPGERGEGSLSDATLAGWDGFRATAAYEELHRGDERIPAEQEALVLVVANTVLRVERRGPPGDPSGVDVEEVAEDVLAALG